jgi:hydrogenase nickel incorporation protein HypA/HybF
MHELAIAQRIVEIACERSAGARVLRVVVRVGELAAVSPDALRFCLDEVARDTLAAGARFDLVEVAGRARCRACGGEVELGRCVCGGTDVDWISGHELEVVEMEVA